MIEQILLHSGSLDGMRETGSFGQPLHALYPQIRTVLANELGADAARLLAEPVVDHAGSRVDWYTEGDPDDPPRLLNELPEEQRNLALKKLEEWLDQGRNLAEHYLASKDAHKLQFGAILQAVFVLPPTESDVFLVSERLVMTRWGLTPDQPWEVPLSSAERLPSKLTEIPRNVVIPDLPIPEQVSAETNLEMAAPESKSEPLPTDSLKPEPPPSEIPTSEPPPIPPVKFASPAISDPISPLTVASSHPTSVPPATVRNTTGRSKYFWVVCALALLLVAITVFWWLQKDDLHPPMEKTNKNESAHSDPIDTQAEDELTVRSTPLQTQESEQRVEHPTPEVSGISAITPTGEEEVSDTPTNSSNSELPQQDVISTPTIESNYTTSTETSETAEQIAPPLPTAPTSTQTAEISEQIAMPSPSVAPTVTSSTSTLEDALMEQQTSPTSGSLVSTVTNETPAQAPETLEQVLEESTAIQPPAHPAEKLDTPPIATEPTLAERREFTDRLSEVGAATGEITATLLWDGHADLDLVVHCPSGQQLDYRNPVNCGGTLDVDANAVRTALRDRPVENVFWAEGEAVSGIYKIAVRYTPRKDEQNPQKIPFQVRLSRGNQESVFKGAVRPGMTMLITTFSAKLAVSDR